jgi:MFS family permease
MPRFLRPRWLRMFAPWEVRGYLRSAREVVVRQPCNYRFWVLVYLSSGVYSGLFGAFIGMYPRSLGATAAQIGLIASITSMVAWLPQLLGGFLVDRYGRRLLLAGGWVFEAAMLVVSYLAQDWTWLLLAGVVASLGAFGGSANSAFLAESTNERDRAKGTTMLSTVGALPVVILPPVGAALITKLGGVQNPDALRIYFLLSLIRVAVLFTFFHLRTEETLTERRNLSKGLGAIRDLGQDLRELLAVGRVRRYFGYSLLGSFTGHLVGPFQVIVIYEVIGASPVFIGLMTSTSSVISYISMNIGAVWSDRIGRKRPIILASLISGVGWSFFLIARNQYMLVPFYVMTSAAAISSGAGSALAMEYVPSRMRGRWYGTLAFVTLIPASFSPLIGGWLFDTYGPRIPYYVFYVLSFFVMLPIFLRFIPETMNGEQNAGQNLVKDGVRKRIAH